MLLSTYFYMQRGGQIYVTEFKSFEISAPTTNAGRKQRSTCHIHQASPLYSRVSVEDDKC